MTGTMKRRSFAGKLLWLCERDRRSQAEVAKHCGVSRNTINRIVNENRKPSVKVALGVMRLFLVDGEFVLDERVLEPRPTTRSPDEEFVLRVWRAVGISADEAAKRLHGTEPSVAQPRVVAIRDESAIESRSAPQPKRDHKRGRN